MSMTLEELSDTWFTNGMKYHLGQRQWRYADRGTDYYWAALSREWTIGKSVNVLDLLQEGQWK